MGTVHANPCRTSRSEDRSGSLSETRTATAVPSGRVFAGAQDVNAEMVRRGAAWVYRRYSDDPALLHLEQEARTARRGLWALPEAERIPPWEWRAAERRR